MLQKGEKKFDNNNNKSFFSVEKKENGLWRVRKTSKKPSRFLFAPAQSLKIDIPYFILLLSHQKKCKPFTKKFCNYTSCFIMTTTIAITKAMALKVEADLHGKEKSVRKISMFLL